MRSRPALICLLMLSIALSAWSAQPPRFNYQAKLTDSGGAPIFGVHTIFFSLFQGGDAVTAGSGTLVFKESKSLTLAAGLLNHTVGTGVLLSGAMSNNLFRFSGDMFLEVAVDVDTNVVLPRTRLESVPFAINSADGDARTPISGPAPITISQPGSYYLTNNIGGFAGTDAITIDASNVTLDLNGFTLLGRPSAFNAITITDNRTDIVIRNGIITGWPGLGIQAHFANNCLIERIVAHNNTDIALNIGDKSLVKDCVVQDGGATGIILSDASTIAFCTSNGNTGLGINTGIGCTVTNCTTDQNSGIGIEVDSDSAIMGCTSSQNGDSGIDLSGANSRATGNTCSDNGTLALFSAAGILVTANGNFVADNTANGNPIGLHITAANNVVSNNVVRNNDDNYNIVTGNQLNLLLCEIPESIDWPAHVTLAGSMTGVTDSAGITVNSDNVTIDLGGHTLTGALRSLAGILLTSTREHVEIRNGVISGWSRSGVEATTSTNGICSDLRVHNCGLHGIDTSSGWVIDHCVTEQNGTVAGANNGNGIKTTNSSVTNCVSRNNDGNGIFAGSNCVVTGCIASSNPGAGNNGIQIGGGGVASNCVANNNGESGILGATATIRNCTARDNAKDGIVVVSNCQVIDNQCINNGLPAHNGAGIHATSTHNRIERNTASGNHFGIDVDASPNLISSNTVSDSENGDNYTQIIAGNLVGPIRNTAASVTGNTNPMANIEFP